MINKVSFTGRETMLTSALNQGSKVADEALEYVRASSILPKNAMHKVLDRIEATPVYTSPFAPIIKTADEIVVDVNRTGLDFFA